MTADHDVAAGWDRALDDLEAEVEQVASAIAEGRTAPELSWRPPRGLGRLPAAVRGRAEGLSMRIAAVQASARRELERIEGELDGLGRRREAGVAYLRNDGTA